MKKDNFVKKFIRNAESLTGYTHAHTHTCGFKSPKINAIFVPKNREKDNLYSREYLCSLLM